MSQNTFTLEIKNFKGIKDTIFKFQKGINVLVGKNNSGKSTILQALWLSEDPFSEFFDGSRLDAVLNTFNIPIFSRLFYDIKTDAIIGKTKLKYFENPKRIEVYIDDKLYGIASAQFSSPSLQIPPFSLYPYEQKLVEQDKPSQISARIKQIGNIQIREVWKQVDGIKTSSAYISPLFRDRIHQGFQRFWNKINIVDTINYIKEIESVDEITYEPNEEGIPEIFLIKDHKRIPLKSFGDGFQNAIISLIYLNLVNSDILLLDDIEAFMNPQLIEDYLTILANVFKNKTIIIATHSYDVLSILENLNLEGNVYICNLNNGNLTTKEIDINQLGKIGFDIRYPSTLNII